MLLQHPRETATLIADDPELSEALGQSALNLGDELLPGDSCLPDAIRDMEDCTAALVELIVKAERGLGSGASSDDDKGDGPSNPWVSARRWRACATCALLARLCTHVHAARCAVVTYPSLAPGAVRQVRPRR